MLMEKLESTVVTVLKVLIKQNNLNIFPHRLNHIDAKVPLNLIR